MLIVISPAKNLDYDSPVPSAKATKATLLKHSETLVEQLKKLAPHELSKLMGISDKLGSLNYDRYQEWSQPFTAKNSRQAVFAFNGDVYSGLEAQSFDEHELNFAQEHLRILSGLYGVLRPLDRMRPYRLEMGTRFNNEKGKDLYAFWGDTLTRELNKQLKKLATDCLINLASKEYFKAVDKQQLDADIITPVFKDKKSGKYKIISFFAKKARGRMCAYIIKNKITDANDIKAFDWDGYSYHPKLSSDSEWVFTREEQA